jgi:hypothetical protein
VKLLYGAPDVVAEFVEARIFPPGHRGLPRPMTAIGVMSRGALIGGFVYHDWQPEAGVVELSCAADDKRWFNRETLYALHEYPFVQMGCQMVATRTSARKTDLLRQHAAYGYRLHVIPRMLGRDHDGVITTLTVEDWRASPFTTSYLKRINPDG